MNENNKNEMDLMQQNSEQDGTQIDDPKDKRSFKKYLTKKTILFAIIIIIVLYIIISSSVKYAIISNLEVKCCVFTVEAVKYNSNTELLDGMLKIYADYVKKEKYQNDAWWESSIIQRMSPNERGDLYHHLGSMRSENLKQALIQTANNLIVKTDNMTSEQIVDECWDDFDTTIHNDILFVYTAAKNKKWDKETFVKFHCLFANGLEHAQGNKGTFASRVIEDKYKKDIIQFINNWLNTNEAQELDNRDVANYINNYLINTKADNALVQKSKNIKDILDYKSSIDSEASQTPPRIGMTYSELQESTWGSPTRENKTTTAYGDTSQCVYSNNRYVYLENGIVTAIQE